MKDQRVLWNPFRMISPKLDEEIGKIEELYRADVSQTRTPEESILIMLAKLIQVTRILSASSKAESLEKLAECEELVRQVHELEKIATASILGASSTVSQIWFRTFVRFPSRIERIGVMFETILGAIRIKIKDGIPFSDKAQNEIHAILDLLAELLVNLRDSMVITNRVLLHHIESQCERLGQLVEDARLAHWERLEAGFCSPQANAIFLCILDSVKNINQYISNMKDNLLELAG
jgi:Na+/phosphate symporter